MAGDTRHAITIRMESTLHAALREVAQRQHVSLDQLVERYCAQGLANADAQPLDSQTVLALRILLEEIVERRVEQRMDAQANRLTTLILRAIRQAAFAHRFLYHSIARTDRVRADAIEEQAAQDTSWLLASNIDDEARRTGTGSVDEDEEEEELAKFQQVMVPLDGSTRAGAVLRMVETVAHDVLRTVTLLHVIDAPEQGPEAERYLAAWRTGGNARASRASVA